MNRAAGIALVVAIVAAAAFVFPPSSVYSQSFTGPIQTIGAAPHGNATTAWFVETSTRTVVACTSEGPKTAPVCRPAKF